MTAREMIKALQDLGEDKQEMEVLIHDEYRYVNIDTVKIVEEPEYYDEYKRTFIGIY